MGEIIIDAKCETSVKGVFAAGDCTTVPYKQIIIATGEGAKASLSSFDYLIRTQNCIIKESKTTPAMPEATQKGGLFFI